MAINKTVSEFTIPLEAYPHLQDDQTLQDAINIVHLFACNDYLQFAEVLILNDKKQVIGQVTVHEILQGIEPRLLKKEENPDFEGLEIDYPNLAILWEDSFFKECHKRVDKPIKEFLSPIKATVKASDPLLKALYIMTHTNENNLPVLEDNKVVGMIRINEVFAAICSYCELY